MRLQSQGCTVVVLEQDPRSQELATYTPPKNSEVVLVVGNEVGEVVALVGGAADLAPVDAAAFRRRQHQREQGEG